MNYDLQLALS